MSKEPKQNSISPAKSAREASQQAERVAHRASRTNGDGQQESIEVLAERSWSGALPRPEDFAKFGEVIADAPERILRMAEKEQEHRIALEAQLVPANTSAARRGQLLGAGISIAALGLAALTSYWGAPWAVSVAMVGVPVLSVARSLVTAFKTKAD
jgi:uncharacterized membrane protein